MNSVEAQIRCHSDPLIVDHIPRRSHNNKVCPRGVSLTILACRNKLEQEADWANLPFEILNIIIEKLTANLYYQPRIVAMRLVCKAWRDALAYFGGPASLDCNEDIDVQHFCSSLPGTSCLSVHINSPDVNITALSVLSLLSKITFSGEEASESAVEEALSMLHQFPLLKVNCFWSIL